MNSFLPSQHGDQPQDLTPQELERLEQALSGLQKDLSPTLEFTERMTKRLERHAVIMQELASASPDRPRASFFSFFGSRVYSTLTAFAFVLFTGSFTTFAYTSESVTNDSLLYPIKRGLERIEQTFATSSPESSAEFHVKMLRRRLAESRVLTMRGLVDARTSLDVTSSVNDGIAAIANVSETGYRNQLIDRMTVLLKEEEQKIYDRVGVTLPSEAPREAAVSGTAASEAAVVAPAIETSETSSSTTAAPASRPEIIQEKPAESRPAMSQERPMIVVPRPVMIPGRVISAEPPPLRGAVSPRPTVISGETRSQVRAATEPAREPEKEPEQRRGEPSVLAAPQMTLPITIPLHVRQEVRDALQINSRQMRDIEERLREVRRER